MSILYSVTPAQTPSMVEAISNSSKGACLLKAFFFEKQTWSDSPVGIDAGGFGGDGEGAFSDDGFWLTRGLGGGDLV